MIGFGGGGAWNEGELLDSLTDSGTHSHDTAPDPTK